MLLLLEELLFAWLTDLYMVFVLCDNSLLLASQGLVLLLPAVTLRKRARKKERKKERMRCQLRRVASRSFEAQKNVLFLFLLLLNELRLQW